MVTLELQGLEQVRRQLLRVQERTGNMYPLMTNIGEHMVNSTHDNFETGTAPDGTPWAANSQATYLSLLGKSHTNKSGRLNKRGTSRVQSKRPLILTHTLSEQIRYQATPTAVMIGSNQVYARMMHFGGTKAQFPHLWGDIPARPFLGLRAGDDVVIEEMVRTID